jgi:hypothetical protein
MSTRIGRQTSRQAEARPPTPLSQEKQDACTRARSALDTIERLVPQERQRASQKRKRALLGAYKTLSWQCPILGIGIQPFHEYSPEKLLKIAAIFKQQLEQRYPQQSQ